MYAPASGDGISGGRFTASGKVVADGMAACPHKIPFGTKVLVTGVDLSEWGLPQIFTCQDHMAAKYATGHMDIALVAGDAKWRIAMATRFGRRKLAVYYDKEKLKCQIVKLEEWCS